MQDTNARSLKKQAVTTKNSPQGHPRKGLIPPQQLPAPTPEALAVVWQGLEDEPANSLTAALGCVRISTSGCKNTVAIPRRSSVVAVRNTAGNICGLHDVAGRWFTKPQLHFCNLRRLAFRREIHVFTDTLSAEIAADSLNIAAVAQNGIAWATLVAVTHQLGASIVDERFPKISLDAPTWKGVAA